MAKTESPAELEKQIDALRVKIIKAQTALGERRAQAAKLEAEKQKAIQERALYVLSHAAINGTAPDPTAAERRYSDNAIAIAELQRQISDMTEQAADLEQVRLDRRTEQIKEKRTALLKERGEALQKLQAAEREYAAVDFAISTTVTQEDLYFGEAMAFRNAGGRQKFIIALQGETVTA